MPETTHPFAPVDFAVELMDLPHPMRNKEIADGTRLAKRETIPARKAVVRPDTGAILNIVSSRYQLVPHMNVFGPINTALEELKVPIKSVVVRTGDEGGQAQATWTLDRQVGVNGNDDVDLTIVGRNSYNYTNLASMALGGRRLICKNGMTIAIPDLATYAKRHVPSLNVSVLVEEITTMLANVERFRTDWARWKDTEYTPEKLSTWLEGRGESVSKKAREQVVEYFQTQPDRSAAGLGEARMNGWEAFNALTWFATHQVNTRSDEAHLRATILAGDLANAFAAAELGYN